MRSRSAATASASDICSVIELRFGESHGTTSASSPEPLTCTHFQA